MNGMLYSVLLHGSYTRLCLQRVKHGENEKDLFRHIPMILFVILLIYYTACAIYRLGFLPMAGRIIRLAILIQRSAHARLSSSRPHLRSLPLLPLPCVSANVVASSTIPRNSIVAQCMTSVPCSATDCTSEPSNNCRSEASIFADMFRYSPTTFSSRTSLSRRRTQTAS